MAEAAEAAEAAEDSITTPSSLPGTLTKLPPIPQGAQIQKRPLSRPQLPSSSKCPVIYVSSSTPFMSAVKRVRKALEKPGKNNPGGANKHASLHQRIEALKRGTGKDEGGGGAVVKVMGTGKAVEKTLAVASWFEQQVDCRVRVRTGTVGAVDDVVVVEGEVEDEGRVRGVSCLEVLVSLRYGYLAGNGLSLDISMRLHGDDPRQQDIYHIRHDDYSLQVKGQDNPKHPNQGR